MKASATYAVYARQLFDSLALEAPARDRLADLLAELAERPVPEQHAPLAELLNILAAAPGHRAFGFALGAQIPLTAYGRLSLALRIAPNYRRALQLVARYHALEVPLVSYAYADAPEGGVFSVAFKHPLDADAEALMMAAVTSAIGAELSRIARHHSGFSRIELTAASRGMEDLYRRHVSICPEVGHAVNRLFFDEWVLALPNPLADAATFEQLQSEFETQARSETPAQSRCDWVREKIITRIADPPGLKELAEIAKVSERQLRFALAKEGENYRNILKNCRLEFIDELIRNRRLQISEIAYQLGYSELATFTNSFKRWTGQTPTEYRQERLQKPG